MADARTDPGLTRASAPAAALIEKEQRQPPDLASALSPRGLYDRGFRFRWTPPWKQKRTAVGAIAPSVTFAHKRDHCCRAERGKHGRSAGRLWLRLEDWWCLWEVGRMGVVAGAEQDPGESVALGEQLIQRRSKLAVADCQRAMFIRAGVFGAH